MEKDQIKCILCSSLSKSSLEHILPKGLFDGHMHELFRTKKICEKCNNDLGREIDGAFLRDPIILWVRNNSKLKFIFSKFIYISKDLNVELHETTDNIKNSYRIDLYYANDIKIYHITKITPTFKLYVGDNPLQKHTTYAIIEMLPTFKLANTESHLKKTSSIIYKCLGTKQIYLKTELKSNNTNEIPITKEQVDSFYEAIGIKPIIDLDTDRKKVTDLIFDYLNQEANNYGHNIMNIKFDFITHYREMAKIAYLIGINLFEDKYQNDPIALALHAVMSEIAFPYQNLILISHLDQNLNDIKTKCFDTFIEKCKNPVIIINISASLAPNSIVMLVCYGAEKISHLFFTLITENKEYINQFNMSFPNGLQFIKHTNKEDYKDFLSMPHLLSYIMHDYQDL